MVFYPKDFKLTDKELFSLSKDNEYCNAHKHCHYSNVLMIDSVARPMDYFNKAIELKHSTVFTTQHGLTLGMYEYYDLTKQLDGVINDLLKVIDDEDELVLIQEKHEIEADKKLKEKNELSFDIPNLIRNLKENKDYRIRYRFGCEIYFTTDERNTKMYHLLLLAQNQTGAEDITELVSNCVFNPLEYRNKRPKVTLSNLLKLNPSNVIITSACLASYINRIKSDDSNIGKVESIFTRTGGALLEEGKEEEDVFVETFNDDSLTKLFVDTFGKSFYIEMQMHNTQKQIEYNKRCLELSRKYDVPLFAGVDSHAISQEQVEMRDSYLRAKGIIYEDEEGWNLEYISYEECVRWFKQQNIMTNEEIYVAMENTKICLNFGEIKYDTSTRKIPTIYPHLTQEERNKKYVDLIQEKWIEYKKEVPKERWEEYEKEIEFEVNIITSTNVSDYFLFNYELIKRSVERGGIITRTGRGSAPSFITNFFLGFTNIDRLSASVKMYPTRFLTAERILSGSLPDID